MNWVVAIAGVSVIALALAGLVELEARAGPFDEAVVPVETRVTIQGSYLARPAQGSQGPGGVCVPSAPETSCSAPRLEVTIHVDGLVRLGPSAAYVAFLEGGSLVLRLGTLSNDAEIHTLRFAEDRDAQAYTRLFVTLEPSGVPPAPGSLVLWTHDVAGNGRDGPSSLEATPTVVMETGAGRVRVAEIGAMSKSVTVIGEIHDLRRPGDWTYHAWFESRSLPAHYVDLGAVELDQAGSGSARIDARVENLRLEDQARFLITWEQSGTEPGASPAGIPVLQAPLD